MNTQETEIKQIKAIKNVPSMVEDAFEIKDGQKGIVKIIISMFLRGGRPVIDTDGEFMTQNTFAKSIITNKQYIRHLLDHEWEERVGLPLAFDNNAERLAVDSVINLAKEDGLELYNDYIFYAQNGFQQLHSVGYSYMEQNRVFNEDVQAYEYLEANLMEYSTVTFPANKFAGTLEIKAENKPDIESILTKMYDFNLSTDERLKTIENSLNYLVGAQKQIELNEQRKMQKLIQDIKSKLHI